MAFDPIMMSQLGKVKKSLRSEIVEILGDSCQPLNVQDIFQQSNVATLSRDISLELVLMKNDGLVEIAEMRKREGFRAVAHWRLTEKFMQELRA